jgi:hypothetical protein
VSMWRHVAFPPNPPVLAREPLTQPGREARFSSGSTLIVGGGASSLDDQFGEKPHFTTATLDENPARLA